jgi:hypothetical protein
MGQKWLEVMKKIDKELTKEFYNLLMGPMVWNSYHGVVQVDTPYFIGLTHTFPYLEKPRIIEYQGITAKKFTKGQKTKRIRKTNGNKK